MEYAKVLTETCSQIWERICLTACIGQTVEFQIFDVQWERQEREFNWCDLVTIDVCIPTAEPKTVSALRAIFDAYESAAQGILIHKDSASGGIVVDTVNNRIRIVFDPEDTCCFAGRAANLVWSLVLVAQDGATVKNSQGNLFIAASPFGLFQRGQVASDGSDELLLDFVQGKDLHRKFTWKHPDGTALDFTSATARLQIRDKLPVQGGIVLFEAVSGDGRLTVNPAGEVLLDVLPVDTAAMTFTAGIWELEVYLPGNVVKYLQGNVSVAPEIVV